MRWLAPFLPYENSLKVGPDELGSFRHQFSAIVLVKSSLACLADDRSWLLIPTSNGGANRAFVFNGQLSGQTLYSLAGGGLDDGHGNTLKLCLSTRASDLQHEDVLPDEILGRPVDGNECWKLHAKALLHVRRPQLTLLDSHLAMCGWRDQAHSGQGSGCAIIADGGENTRVDVRVGLARDLALDSWRLCERERWQRKIKTDR